MNDSLTTVTEIAKQVDTLKHLSLIGLVLAGVMLGMVIQKLIVVEYNKK